MHVCVLMATVLKEHLYGEIRGTLISPVNSCFKCQVVCAVSLDVWICNSGDEVIMIHLLNTDETREA